MDSIYQELWNADLLGNGLPALRVGEARDKASGYVVVDEPASSGSQRDATGFEHVFVGEQGSKRNAIGGYHFWYKYYLDDGGQGILNSSNEDRMHYFGTRYGGARNPDRGILIPEIVTLALRFDAPLGDTRGARQGQSITLGKPVGGFFVGCSPEGLIALGMVRCRTQSGKIAKINGAEYQLDLHRMDGHPDSIRTFFPRFRRADFIDIKTPQSAPPSPPTPEPAPHTPPAPNTPPNTETEPSENPALRIIAAMVNPKNPEGGREFVQLMNTSSDIINLDGWQIVAPNGTTFTLGEIPLEPGHVYRFVFPVKQSVLRNKLGTIQLLDEQDKIVQICEYTSEAAAQEGAPILF